MTIQTDTVTAGVGATPDPGRPAHDSGRGEHIGEAVLSLESGAGPVDLKGVQVPPSRRPDRPVRFEDPVRNAAYWQRIDAIVDQAPPLTPDQRARIRAAFHAPAMREAV